MRSPGLKNSLLITILKNELKAFLECGIFNSIVIPIQASANCEYDHIGSVIGPAITTMNYLPTGNIVSLYFNEMYHTRYFMCMWMWMCMCTCR